MARHLSLATQASAVFLVALLGSVSGTAAEDPPVEGVLYQTGFEAGESTPFIPGDLQGQGGWTVSEGTVLVQEATARGLQAFRSDQASFRLGLGSEASVLWVDAFFLDPGSNGQPMIPSGPVSSVLFFSTAQGVLALDGDGQGNGNFVQVAPSLAASEFTRVTIRNDYRAKTYDVWINGRKVRGGLRFKNNSVTHFSGLKRRSGGTSYVDDFSVTTWGLDADSDGDGLNDLDEVKFYGTNPLRVDSDGDGVSDGAEVLAGTSPTDPKSLFALKIDLDPQGHHWLRLPIISGRQYTLQRRRPIAIGVWENVPDATGIAGDGLEKAFPQPNGPGNYFYRAVINP